MVTANEDKKDFNAMLNDSKDMPKFQTITDEKSIEKYGGDRMYFAPPIDYDKVMRLVPFGKLLEKEGHTIIQKGRKNIRYYVKDYEKALFTL